MLVAYCSNTRDSTVIQGPDANRAPGQHTGHTVPHGPQARRGRAVGGAPPTRPFTERSRWAQSCLGRCAATARTTRLESFFS
ncbi:hypothetical protein ABH930_002524 [Kitasatospora sp. GAS204A]|nr:hypothetical protein [Kitasatospora sp. GAS204B]